MLRFACDDSFLRRFIQNALLMFFFKPCVRKIAPSDEVSQINRADGESCRVTHAISYHRGFISRKNEKVKRKMDYSRAIIGVTSIT